MKLKKTHLEFTKEMATRTETLVSKGVVGEEENQVMKLATEKAELDLKTSLANLDEVNASGEIPLNELYTPVVGSRDFVSERLKIERKEAELGLKPLGSRLGRFQPLVKKGLVSKDQLDQIQAEMAARKATIGEIQKRLDLRKRFVAGTIMAQEVEIEDRMTEAERNMSSTQSKVDSLQEQLKRLRALETRGLISPTESHKLQYALDAAQFELKLAAVEMDVLQKAK
ncbi:MAG: hypothetical protein IMZ57_04920 [Acidobacteria bacterium]|nr:hypothetical protein [Acidobacteriota bacterium]